MNRSAVIVVVMIPVNAGTAAKRDSHSRMKRTLTGSDEGGGVGGGFVWPRRAASGRQQQVVAETIYLMRFNERVRDGDRESDQQEQIESEPGLLFLM